MRVADRTRTRDHRYHNRAHGLSEVSGGWRHAISPAPDCPRLPARSHHSGSLRERLVTSTEELYSEIHDALENTIKNATKRRMKACPSCGHRFSVLIPDHGAVVAAANTLLAKAIPTTTASEEEMARLENTPPEEFHEPRPATSSGCSVTVAGGPSVWRRKRRRSRNRSGGTCACSTAMPKTPSSRSSRKPSRRTRTDQAAPDRGGPQPVMRADLPLLPGERRPHEGQRPTLDRIVEPSSEEGWGRWVIPGPLLPALAGSRPTQKREALAALTPALDFYNRFRPHRALRGLTPTAARQQPPWDIQLGGQPSPLEQTAAHLALEERPSPQPVTSSVLLHGMLSVSSPSL